MLEQEIIKTLAFFDIFNKPLTSFELWQFLGVKAGLKDVTDSLSSMCHSRAGGNPGFSAQELEKMSLSYHPDPAQREKDLNSNEILKTSEIADPSPLAQDDKKIDGVLNNFKSLRVADKKDGFYFLSGKSFDYVQGRREFFQLSEKKFRIAKRATKILCFVPGIKMIAVCNNFYYRPESDIDFFIITKEKRLWLSRFLAIIFLDFFHLRARGKKTANRICLSFYLSEASLNLENIILKPADPYFIYWLANLEPIYGQKVYEEFWQANSWLKDALPNIEAKKPASRRRVTDNIFSSGYKKLKNFFLAGRWGDWLEKIFKKIQWLKIPAKVKAMSLLNDKRVVINEQMLKFHENDRREEFSAKLEAKLKELKIN